MPTIEKYLKVRTFTTPDGKPTCASNFKKKEFCMFYGTIGFGAREVCMATGQRITRDEFTVPVADCPMKNAIILGVINENRN